ncbi:hypothetical protein H4582DRAFT_2060014 [Lactarius indigo]|nr:hypothetical protein H4582DRAFT_2060014 [Lactarius indigo]
MEHDDSTRPSRRLAWYLCLDLATILATHDMVHGLFIASSAEKVDRHPSNTTLLARTRQQPQSTTPSHSETHTWCNTTELGHLPGHPPPSPHDTSPHHRFGSCDRSMEPSSSRNMAVFVKVLSSAIAYSLAPLGQVQFPEMPLVGDSKAKHRRSTNLDSSLQFLLSNELQASDRRNSTATVFYGSYYLPGLVANPATHLAGSINSDAAQGTHLRSICNHLNFAVNTYESSGDSIETAGLGDEHDNTDRPGPDPNSPLDTVGRESTASIAIITEKPGLDQPRPARPQSCKARAVPGAAAAARMHENTRPRRLQSAQAGVVTEVHTWSEDGLLLVEQVWYLRRRDGGAGELRTASLCMWSAYTYPVRIDRPRTFTAVQAQVMLHMTVMTGAELRLVYGTRALRFWWWGVGDAKRRMGKEGHLDGHD